MPDARSVVVRLRADVADFVGAMGRATAATTATAEATQASAIVAQQAAAAKAKAAEAMVAAAQAEAVAQAAAAESTTAAAAAARAAAAAQTDASAENVAASQAAAAAAQAAAAVEVEARTAAALAAKGYTDAQLQVNAAAQAGAVAAQAAAAAVTAAAEAEAAAAATMTAQAEAAALALAAQTDASAALASAAAFAAAAVTEASATEAAAYGRAAAAAQTAAAAQVAANEAAAAAAAGAATTQTAAATTGMGRLVASAKSSEAAWSKVGGTFLLTGAAAAAGLGLAVKEATDFDAEMARVAALSHASAGAMDQLREAALKAGQTTQFTSTQVAQGMTELVKAGISTKDILTGGLTGALSLAAAGEVSVGDAAEDAASAMTQFGLTGKDLPHVADLLAAGADKAQGGVGDLAYALKNSGMVAHQFGISIDSTVGTLTAFAAQGMLGSDAGTALKMTLLALSHPSVEASQKMAELGIHAYDAGGNFVGLANFAGQLHDKLGGLTQEQRSNAEATMFGAHAVRAATILYEEGASGIQEYTDKVNDTGFAALTASKKMDSLSGDLTKLKGSLQTDLVGVGEGAQGPLRGLTQNLTDLANKYSSLSPAGQEAVLATTGVIAVVGLAGGAFLTLAPKLLTTINGFRTLSQTMPGVASGMTTVGKAAVGIMAAAVAMEALNVAVHAYADSDNTSIEGTTKALLGLSTNAQSVDKVIAKTSDGMRYNFKNLADAAHQFTDPSARQQMSDTFMKIVSFGKDSSVGKDALIKQLGTIGDSLGTLVSSGHADLAKTQFADLANEWVEGGGKLADLKKMMPGYTNALDAAANAQKLSGAAAGAAASGISDVGESAKEAAAAVGNLNDAIDSLFGQFFSVQQAQDAFQTGLNGIAAQAAKAGTALEGNTQAAVDNREAIIDLVRKGDDQLQAMAKQGASADELTAKSGELKNAILNEAAAHGYSRDQVEKYAAELDQVPALVATTIQVDTSAASAKIAALRAQLAGLGAAVLTDSGVTAATKSAKVNSLVFAGKHADGGLIDPRLGGPRQDNVTILASGGEFVTNAAATAKHLPLLEAMNAGKFADGGLISPRLALAAGAPVPTAVSAASVYAGVSATPSPLTVERYTAALAAQARTADAAAAAEKNLTDLQDANTTALQAYKQAQGDAEEALKSQQQAGLDALDKQLETLKNADSAAEDAARNRKASAKDIRALTAAAGLAEQKLQDQITAAKQKNTAASNALSDANDKAYKQAQTDATAKETTAQTALTAAKDQDTSATKELTDATDALNQAQTDALALAQSIAASAKSGSDLSALWGDQSASTLSAAAAALAKMSTAADAATTAVAGESATDALTRRTQALTELANAGSAYAAAQETFGLSDQQVQAGLDQVTSKVSDLGAAYGLTSDAITGMTSTLTTSTRSGSDLLASLQRQLAKTTELSADVRQLMGAGLDSDLVQQVVTAGVSGGGLDMARAILAGSGDLVAQLNATSEQLTSVANNLGTAVSSSVYAPGYTGGAVPAYSASTGITATLSSSDVAALSSLAQALANRPVVLSSTAVTGQVNAVNSTLAYRTAT